MNRAPRIVARWAVLALLTLLFAAPFVGVGATSGLKRLHWARTSNRSAVTVRVGDNVSGEWDGYLRQAVAQWNASKVLNVGVASGTAGPASCNPTTGKVEVCSANYDRTGWLGLTRLFYDDRDPEHLSAVTVRINDYYFRQGEWNDPVAKLHTFCQELGHAMGLSLGRAHPDTRSCLNDDSDAVFRYDEPIGKDYDKLEQRYDHKDGGSNRAAPAAAGASFFDPVPLPTSGAVRPTARGGKTVRTEALGGGRHVVTIVSWAD